MAYDLVCGKDVPRDWSIGRTDLAPTRSLTSVAPVHVVQGPPRVEVWTPKQVVGFAKAVDNKIKARARKNGQSKELARRWQGFKKQVPKAAVANAQTVVALKGWNEASDKVLVPRRVQTVAPAKVVVPEAKGSVWPAVLGAAVVLGTLL